VRKQKIPEDVQQYAAAFDAYLRARPDGDDESAAADRMTATLAVLAKARLSQDPVRSHVHRAAAA